MSVTPIVRRVSRQVWMGHVPVGGDAPVIGSPLVAGASVEAEVIDQVKADKVITYHKRRRKHSSQRTRGHRQKLTLVRVTGILGAGVAAVAAAAEPVPAE